MRTVKLQRFSDVDLGARELFTEGVVVLDLSDSSKAHRRRVLDFFSGMIWFRGRLESVDPYHFMAAQDDGSSEPPAPVVSANR